MAVACLNTLNLLFPTKRDASFREKIRLQALRRLHHAQDLNQKVTNFVIESLMACLGDEIQKEWK